MADIRQDIVAAGVRLLNSGCTIETWGNISCIDRTRQQIYITPSGMDYTTMDYEDICICDLTGNWIDGKRKPSIEKDLHVEIYAHRPEIGCVLHTHPIYSTVFSCMGESIPLIIDEAAQVLGDTVKTAKYGLPGSKELAENCILALGQTANACLLQSHGAICLGTDLKSAFKTSTVLEVTAQIYQLIRATGGAALPISQENIEKMQYFIKRHYGQPLQEEKLDDL